MLKATAADLPVWSMQSSLYLPGGRFRVSLGGLAARRRPFRNHVMFWFLFAAGRMSVFPSSARNVSPSAGFVIWSFVSMADGRGSGFVTARGLPGGGVCVFLIFGRLKNFARRGSAACAPTYWTLPVPLNRPAQTPIAYFLLWPTAHASRLPELVPVFHANHGMSAGRSCSVPRGRRCFEESMWLMVAQMFASNTFLGWSVWSPNRRGFVYLPSLPMQAYAFVRSRRETSAPPTAMARPARFCVFGGSGIPTDSMTPQHLGRPIAFAIWIAGVLSD